MSKGTLNASSFGSDAQAIHALNERKETEAENAAERLASHKKEHERMNLENQRKALLDGIQPLKRIERKRPGRQLNIQITDEEHENLVANAREHGVSMRDLLMTALRPALTRLGKAK